MWWRRHKTQDVHSHNERIVSFTTAQSPTAENAATQEAQKKGIKNFNSFQRELKKCYRGPL
jgi:hypothetical protein